MVKRDKLNPERLGLSMGIVFGVACLILGLIAWGFDWGTGIVIFMSDLYIGYSPNFLGSLIGTIWGFVDGFIGGWFIAWLYNKF